MQSRKRYVEYDLMRILACFCVIMIHTAVFDQKELFEFNTLSYQAINIWGTLSRWAVPAFVMLSGMMVLPRADEISIKKLMLHRVLRMIGAYIAWSVVYFTYNVFVLGNIYAGTALKTWIDGWFSGEIHMWYLPMLAGLYIASPLLAVLIKNLNKKWTLYWLRGMFIFSSIIPFFVKLDVKFLSVIVDSINSYINLQFFEGWSLYFVLGYYIQNHTFTTKEKKITYVVGLAAFAFTFAGTVIYSWINGKTFGILPYEYPNIVLMSVAIVVYFKENVSKLRFLKTFEKQICFVSSLTFGIYLIHVLLLKILYSVGVNIQMFHPILSIPALALIVFVSGGLIIWIIRKIPIFGTYFA